MSETRQLSESPAQVVTETYYAHIATRGRGQIANYCLSVALRYVRLHPEEARTLPFDVMTGTTGQIQDRATKLVSRWMDPTTTQHLPADALYCCIEEFPEHVRADCWTRVMRAMQRMNVPYLERDADPCELYGVLIELFGELTQATGPIIADGKLCPKDRPFAPLALQKLDRLEDAIAAWRRALLSRVMGGVQ